MLSPDEAPGTSTLSPDEAVTLSPDEAVTLSLTEAVALSFTSVSATSVFTCSNSSVLISLSCIIVVDFFDSLIRFKFSYSSLARVACFSASLDSKLSSVILFMSLFNCIFTLVS